MKCKHFLEDYNKHSWKALGWKKKNDDLMCNHDGMMGFVGLACKVVFLFT
jgi:hypothetical protein